MKIVFIRHADPDYQHDSLTPKGVLEAKSLGKYYKSKDFDYIYCSPMGRAKLTCEHVIKDKKRIIYKDWLKEFHHHITIDGKEKLNWDFLPSYIEKHKEDMFDISKYVEMKIFKDVNMKKELDLVHKEFDKLLEEHGYKRKGILYEAKKPNNDVIVIFAHLGINSVLASHLINIPYWQFAQYFCFLTSSVTTFVTEEREDGIAQFRCLSFSNLDHLSKENIKPSFSARFRETRFSKDRKD